VDVGLNISKTGIETTYRQLAVVSAVMWHIQVSYPSDIVAWCGCKIEETWRFCMQMLINQFNIMAGNHDCMHYCIQLFSIQWELVCHYGEC
jgi:hypothetical protein